MQLQPKKIAIVGHGRFGRFWEDFFRKRGCEVKTSDVGTTPSTEEIVVWADVVLIAVTLMETVKVTQSILHLLRRHQMLMSISSTMVYITKVMLESSCGEVFISHPFCAPPRKRGTFKGQTLFVHRARRAPEWAVWVEALLEASEANIKNIQPEQHDLPRIVDQLMDHGCSLWKVGVARTFGINPKELLEIASPAYNLSLLHLARMLKQDGHLYGGLPMSNPYAMKGFEAIEREVKRYTEAVRANDMAAYVRNFDECAAYLGQENIDALFELSEEVNALVIDLQSPNSIRAVIPEDRPGIMKQVGAMFEEEGINLTAFNGHAVEGTAEFFIAFNRDKSAPEIQRVRKRLEQELHAKVT